MNCRGTTTIIRYKRKEGIFRLDIKRKFFAVEVVRHWDRLPKETVDAPTQAVLKARLGKALSNWF